MNIIEQIVLHASHYQSYFNESQNVDSHEKFILKFFKQNTNRYQMFRVYLNKSTFKEYSPVILDFCIEKVENIIK